MKLNYLNKTALTFNFNYNDQIRGFTNIDYDTTNISTLHNLIIVQMENLLLFFDFNLPA